MFVVLVEEEDYMHRYICSMCYCTLALWGGFLNILLSNYNTQIGIVRINIEYMYVIIVI